jgi:PAS domain S-box-containing protein
MFRLDMRTALFSYMLISLISTFLVALIIKQFSNRYKGVYQLFFCFLLQAIALLLILVRGLIPDWISFDLSNSISIGGIILFLSGIERYTGQKSFIRFNLVLLTVFILIHTWFTFVKNDLSIRHLNVSIAWLILFLQSSILLLFRIRGSGLRRILPMKFISIAFCLVCLARIVKFVVRGHSDDYFQSDLFDIVIIIICQILLILLIFSIAYMLGGRLFDDVRAEEQKFSKIFHTAPFAIMLSRLTDGRIIEVNKVFLDKTEYFVSEVLGKTTFELSLWSDYEKRTEVMSELEKYEKVQSREIIIRTKTGKRITGLLNSEVISVNDEKCVFSSIEDITERKLAEIKLKNSKELLEKLNEHLVDVRENERKNIALALHDDLGQRLTGLFLDFAWLKNKLTGQQAPVMRKLDQLSRTVLETIENVKETSAMLRPAILFELGLIPAIKSNLKKIEIKSGIKCRFYSNPARIEPDNRTSLVVFRIFQESMTNIVWHSRAKNAEVRISLTGEDLEITIRDDGRGITSDQINSLESMGLTGMRERVRAVSGKIEIKGEMANGTSIIVVVPYKTANTLSL